MKYYFIVGGMVRVWSVYGLVDERWESDDDTECDTDTGLLVYDDEEGKWSSLHKKTLQIETAIVGLLRIDQISREVRGRVHDGRNHFQVIGYTDTGVMTLILVNAMKPGPIHEVKLVQKAGAWFGKYVCQETDIAQMRMHVQNIPLTSYITLGMHFV